MSEHKMKLFSRKDGTTLPEDLKEIFESKWHDIKQLLDKFGDDAEKIIDALRKVNDEIQIGTPTDQIIQKVLDAIPGHADDAIYAFIQAHLGEWLDDAELIVDGLKAEPVEEMSDIYESLRHKKASTLLQTWVAGNGGTISRVDSDTTIQNVYQMTL